MNLVVICYTNMLIKMLIIRHWDGEQSCKNDLPGCLKLSLYLSRGCLSLDWKKALVILISYPLLIRFELTACYFILIKKIATKLKINLYSIRMCFNSTISFLYDCETWLTIGDSEFAIAKEKSLVGARMYFVN